MPFLFSTKFAVNSPPAFHHSSSSFTKPLFSLSQLTFPSIQHTNTLVLFTTALAFIFAFFSKSQSHYSLFTLIILSSNVIVYKTVAWKLKKLDWQGCNSRPRLRTRALGSLTTWAMEGWHLGRKI